MSKRLSEPGSTPEPATAAASLRPLTLGIAGVGLIGGSLAAAAKARGVAGRVVGFGRSPVRLEAAAAAGLLDDFDVAPDRLGPSLDLLVCCLPVDRIAAGVRDVAARMRPGTLATDAGSVKGSVCKALGTEPASGVTFVGSHPLAGSEKAGFEHADAGLFAGRVCVLTPTGAESPAALQALTRFWSGLGCEVRMLSPLEHDAVLARTSHLPHAVAAAVAAGLGDGEECFAAGGFRDATRVAAGDPDLWTAILLANADAVTDALGGLLGRCESLRGALRVRDTAAVRRLLADGKSRRDAFAALHVSR